MTSSPRLKPGDSRRSLIGASCFAGDRPPVSEWVLHPLHRQTPPARRPGAWRRVVMRRSASNVLRARGLPGATPYVRLPRCCPHSTTTAGMGRWQQIGLSPWLSQGLAPRLFGQAPVHHAAAGPPAASGGMPEGGPDDGRCRSRRMKGPGPSAGGPGPPVPGTGAAPRCGGHVEGMWRAPWRAPWRASWRASWRSTGWTPCWRPRTGACSRAGRPSAASTKRLLRESPAPTGEVRPALRVGELALTSTPFTGGATAGVARRQPDGAWLWVIDQPNILR